jgi:hypothetical protein
MLLTCNKCERKFESIEVERDKFYGQWAARVQEFTTCPKCNQTDHHWVYAIDVMPDFKGKQWKVKEQQKQWLRSN